MLCVCVCVLETTARANPRNPRLNDFSVPLKNSIDRAGGELPDSGKRFQSFARQSAETNNEKEKRGEPRRSDPGEHQ